MASEHGMDWELSHRADPIARAIADRHYNRQKPGTPQFVPPVPETFMRNKLAATKARLSRHLDGTCEGMLAAVKDGSIERYEHSFGTAIGFGVGGHEFDHCPFCGGRLEAPGG